MSIDKIKMGDDLTKSVDVVSDNISKLKELFPEIVTEGKIDFKKLQEILGKEIEAEEENYRFTWAGKSQSRREAHKPSTGTLRPCKEESVDWDTTQNLYIEGDNLEVLKLLQKSYSDKIKMIYIDPPYNTGKDFVYKDNYKDNLKNYQQITGQVDSEGNKMSTNSESDGRYHSNWLNMMYPRLRLARNLLTEDGLIFISIDDNEVDNLRKITDEIFGEDNFIGNVIWSKKRGKDNSAKFYSRNHEYLLTYSKSIKKSSFGKLEMPEETRGAYRNQDNDTRGDYRLLGLWARGSQGGSIYDFTDKNGNYFKERSWLVGKETMLQLDAEDKIKVNGDKLYRKLFLTKYKGDIPETIWSDASNAANAADEIKLIFGNQVFDTVKPLPYLKKMIKCGMSNNEGIILDFFAGSSTTAHAIMQLNLEDSGNRKFILVQLPEKTDVKSEAFKSGYKTITEIGKERIRRAGKKIKEENPLHSGNLDIGFKVFKLDSSNIIGWDGHPDKIESSIKEFQNNIKSDRKEEDVVFEIILKYGLDLTLPIEEKIIEGKKVFNVGNGALFICLEDGLTSKVAKGIGQWKESLKPETCRVIFKDSGFTDIEKTSSVLTLKRFGIKELKSI